MSDVNSISGRPAVPPEGEPRWTVITTPPGFAERWAMGAKSSGQKASVALLLLLLAFLVTDIAQVRDNGHIARLFPDVILLALFAGSTWERYAFGQLLERYDAELKRLQSPPEPR